MELLDQTAALNLSKLFVRLALVGPKRATAREPDPALTALKTGKVLLTHATPNTGAAVDHLIVPEV